MPDMIPVGNTIIPPDPMKGVNTLSGIIGIQQQKQNLQTGQYIQQTAAARAQQEGLAAQQTQGVQNFFKTWDPTQHVGDDGTTDLDSALQSDEFKASGNAKPAVMQALLDIKNKQLTNKTALAGLNNALVTQLGQQAGALAKDPDVIADKTDPNTGVNPGRAKIKEMFSNFSQQSPDAARIAAIYSPIATHAPNTKGALSAGIGALQMQARDVGGQQTAQYPGAVTNAAGNILNRTPSTGALSAPPIAGAATPSDVPPSGPVAPRPPGLGLNPSTPQVASATAAGVGQAGTDNQVFAKVMAAGANAQRGIELAQRLQQDAQMARSGQYSEEFANRLTIFKQHDPSATARQMLQKDAENLKSLAEEGATTNEERTQIGGGYPSPETMNPDTIGKAARYWQGSFTMAGARSKNAIDHVSQNGTAGLTLKDQAFMSTASPGKFAPPEPTKTVSMQEVTDYAKKHNLSIDAAKTHVTNNGFQIK